MQKKYLYKIVEEHFDVECEYELDEKDSIYFKEPLGKLLNKYGEDGYEVYHIQFKDFLFYDNDDLHEYISIAKRHSRPFTQVEVSLYLKKLVEPETSDSKAVSNLCDIMLTMSDKMTALTDKVSRLESLLEDKEKKQSNKKI